MRTAACLLALLLATATAAAARVHVSLAGHVPVLMVGKPWTLKLTVRPKSYTGTVRVSAAGPSRVSARASGRRGAYTARLVFPRAGGWTLSASAGGSTSRLGVVQVLGEPLVFVYPTSIAIEPGGSLLVVENGAGRVLRIDPATGAETVVASQLSRPYAVAAIAPAGILLSTDSDIVRLAPGPREVVASAAEQIGPIVATPNGDLYFTITTTAYRVPASSHTPVPIADGLAAPHGLAVAADGALLISDTGHNRVLRVDPSTRGIMVLAQVDEPRGLAVAPDGTVYVCAAAASRIVHLSATGQALGFAGPVFDTPYALAAAADGSVYVTEATAAGDVRRIAPDGTVTTLASG